MTVGFTDVVDATHVGMRHLTRHAHFLVETCQAIRVVGDVVRQKLEGNRLSELQIFSPVDLTHPAAADERHDPVAVGQHGAGNEPCLVERVT